MVEPERLIDFKNIDKLVSEFFAAERSPMAQAAFSVFHYDTNIGNAHCGERKTGPGTPRIASGYGRQIAYLIPA